MNNIYILTKTGNKYRYICKQKDNFWNNIIIYENLPIRNAQLLSNHDCGSDP